MNPPRKRGSPAAEEREKARKFILDALAQQNDRQATKLLADWEKESGSEGTFWRAMRDMKHDGELTSDGGTGTGKKMTLHLILRKPAAPLVQVSHFWR